MKKIFTRTMTLMAMLMMSIGSFAQGSSRGDATNVTAGVKYNLPGVKDQNTISWFLIKSATIGSSRDLVTINVSGSNYGGVDCFYDDATSSAGSATQAGTSITMKQYWAPGTQDMYVAISQDGTGGSVTFNFSKAQQGEVRELALPAQVGSNQVPSGLGTVWYSFTAVNEKIYFINSSLTLSAAYSAETGLSVCPANMLGVEGFYLKPEGQVFFSCTGNNGGTFTITTQDVEDGMFADHPIDITSLNSFSLVIPGDPNASRESSAQVERYFLYNASKDGKLMWGSNDASWMEGMYGASVIDQTTGKRLNTPLTQQQFGMVTYTVNVQADHTYLIAQTLGCTTAKRTAQVSVAIMNAEVGDSENNPIVLSLDQQLDLGRKTQNTKFYAFTATEDGSYTATLHAGGQVRATTPEGSWNINRDYTNQTMQMHIDDEISLRAGERLLLEVTITSDIDIHTDGSEKDIPNYYILISKNGDLPPTDKKEGESTDNPIVGTEGTAYPLYQSSDEDYYDRYYKVEVPAGQVLVVTTSHSPTASSPSPINFTLDGKKWNEVKSTSEMLQNEDGKKTGRRYTVETAAEPRTIFIETDGVSFLYEGATWSYTIQDPTSIRRPLSHQFAPDAIYTLSGLRVRAVSRPGIYIIGGKKVMVR